MSHPVTSSPSGPTAPNLRSDAISGFLVFLVALPLCLGISMASGAPPIAGVFTAIVGGLVSTWVGSAHLTIKGPAAGLIVIVLGAVTDLGQGDVELGYRRMLAVGVVAGVVQIALALARVGRLGDLFPSSVLHGMLAAIGLIIFSKQIHVLLGVKPHGHEPLELLAEIPSSVAAADGRVAMVGFASLAILAVLPRIPLAVAKRVPGPLVVLAVAIPVGAALGLGSAPGQLVDLPASLVSAITLPDFSAIGTATSMQYVFLFAVVGTLESLLSAKAVDHLDPHKRHSDLDRDLLSVGVGNTAAAAIGGLPMISEIVRSSANVANGAQTRAANFFHGAFLLGFVALLPFVIERIPLAALAAMLVYTGFRLASPSEFQRTLRIGWDQFSVFLVTLVGTVAIDLLVGVACGIAAQALLDGLRGAPLTAAFRPTLTTTVEGDEPVVHVGRAAVFSNYLPIRDAVQRAADAEGRVTVDFTDARVVDHTVLEHLEEINHDLEQRGGRLTIRGLEHHLAESAHPQACRYRQVA
jgi:MFS superfamily sulfate permease-like transporter